MNSEHGTTAHLGRLSTTSNRDSYARESLMPRQSTQRVRTWHCASTLYLPLFAFDLEAGDLDPLGTVVDVRCAPSESQIVLSLVTRGGTVARARVFRVWELDRLSRGLCAW